MSRRELFSRFKKFDKELEKIPELVVGLLGIPLGGEKLVEVPTRNGYVFVRLRDSQDELVQAYNDKVSPVYDLPVIVQYKDGRYIIVGRDTNRYGDWGDFSSYLPRHGSTHSFGKDGLSGGDIVWVYGQQFMPYLAQPSGTAGSGNVILNGNTFLKFDGTWRYDGQTGSANLLGNKPTGSSAVMVLIYEDMENGIYNYSVGNPFAENITGTSDVVPYIPSVINPNYNPIAAIRLVSGTSTIKWDNIYDSRQFFRMWATGTFITATGIQGPTGTQGPIGPIGPQGPAGAGNPGLMVWNEGVPLNTGTIFDFVGANIDASISGSVVRVFVTGSAGGAGANFNSNYILGTADGGLPSGTVIPGFRAHPDRAGFGSTGTNAINFEFDDSSIPLSFTGTSAGATWIGNSNTSFPSHLYITQFLSGTYAVYDFVSPTDLSAITGSFDIRACLGITSRSIVGGSASSASLYIHDISGTYTSGRGLEVRSNIAIATPSASIQAFSIFNTNATQRGNTWTHTMYGQKLYLRIARPNPTSDGIRFAWSADGYTWNTINYLTGFPFRICRVGLRLVVTSALDDPEVVVDWIRMSYAHNTSSTGSTMD